MIKKSVFEDELVAGMQRELISQAESRSTENLVQAVEYLNSAAEIFEDAGMKIKADQILNILAKLSDKTPKHSLKTVKDPHTNGLTPDKMVNNLKEHGTVFNMVNDGKEDDSSADDLLNVDVNNELEVSEKDPKNEMDFEDEI